MTHTITTTAAASCDSATSGRDSDKLIRSKFDDFLVSALCLLSGTMTFFIYYQMAMSFIIIRQHIWSGQIFSDLLGGCQYIVSALVSVAMIPINGLQTRFFYISGFLYIFVAVAFPAVVHFFKGMQSFRTGRILLIGVSVLSGMADGLGNVCGFSLAAVLPQNRIAIFSGGVGLSGSIPWLLFIVMYYKIIYSPDSPQSGIVLLWLFFALAGCLALLQILAVSYLKRQRWFRKFLQQAYDNHEAQFVPGENRWKQTLLCKSRVPDEELNQTEADAAVSVPANAHRTPVGSLPSPSSSSSSVAVMCSSHSPSVIAPRSFAEVMKDCGFQVLAAFLLIVSSMMIFPMLMPYSLPMAPLQMLLVLGIAHFSHTTMRFVPACCSFWLRISPRSMLPVTVVRSCLSFPLFICVSRFTNTPVLNSFWFSAVLTFCFSSTHGLLGTLTDIYGPGSVQHPQEKAVASKMLVIAQLLACAVGQFSGKLTLL